MARYYIDCDEGGRVRASSPDTATVGPLLEVPQGFTPETQLDYRLQNGVLVHEPLPAEAPLPTEGERLAALEAAVIELALGGGLSG